MRMKVECGFANVPVENLRILSGFNILDNINTLNVPNVNGKER